jgi:hypothetical protein
MSDNPSHLHTASLRSVLILLALFMLQSAQAVEGIAAISDAGRRGQAPDISIGKDGSVHVVWLDKGPIGTADDRGKYSGGGHSHQSFTDLMYSRSDDGGQTFSEPTRVNSSDGEVWGFAISKPDIAAGPDGSVHILYPVNAVSSTTGKDVASTAYTRSADGGKTFANARILNSDPEEDLSAIISGGLAQAQVFGSMAVADDGAVYTFWLDSREMSEDMGLSSVYMRSSHDNGVTFEAERKLFPTDACPCCQVTVTTDDNDVYLASRAVSGDNIRTPMVSVSRDAGATFSERVAVSGKPWQIEGCPLKPTAIVAEGQFVHTLVHNGAEEPPGLVYSRSGDSGASFEGSMMLHPDAAVSNHPALVSTSKALVAVWHAKVGEGRNVYLRSSRDHGTSFGPISELPAPKGTAAYPDAAAMPDGSIVVVWQQGEQILAQRISTP